MPRPFAQFARPFSLYDLYTAAEEAAAAAAVPHTQTIEKKKVKNRNQILENGTKFGVNLQHPEAVNPTHNPMSHIIIQRSFRRPRAYHFCFFVTVCGIRTIRCPQTVLVQSSTHIHISHSAHRAARARFGGFGPSPASAIPNFARGGNGERVDLNPDLAAENLLDVSKVYSSARFSGDSQN